ncbi:MAG: Ppx/GppA phosphatase family protein [Ignavibacteriota bacterium]
MRQGVIDIGTNTCLLVIAESDECGSMRILADLHAIARLGAGVDATKQIQPESYQRLKKILTKHAQSLSEFGLESVTAIATSAMRDAANREEIIASAQRDTGIRIEVISGDDESFWSYRGALCGIPPDELSGEIAALDIGGGSTELSHGKDGIYRGGNSIDIGAVRIKERCLSKNDPESVHAARTYIRTALQDMPPIAKAKKLIAVAGTPTALAAMKLRLVAFDAAQINGTRLLVSEVSDLTNEILELSPADLVNKYPVIHPDRADILPAGVLILEETMKHLGINEVQVSTYGLRFGILIREFERQMNSSNASWTLTHR